MAHEQWPHVFKMVAARDLNADEARIWHHAIRDDYADITDQELCAVLEWAFCDTNVKQFRRESPFSYTQPMLSYWVRQYRAAKRAENYCARCRGTGMFTLFCRRREGGHIIRFCTREEYELPAVPGGQDYPSTCNAFCTCDLGAKMKDKEVPFDLKQRYMEFQQQAIEAQATCGAET